MKQTKRKLIETSKTAFSNAPKKVNATGITQTYLKSSVKLLSDLE